MRPLDRRVLPHLRPAKLPLSLVVVGSTLSGVCAIAQAFVLGMLVVRLLTGGDWQPLMWWLVAVSVARAATSGMSDLAATHAAGLVTTRLRRLVIQRALQDPSGQRVGELGLLATRGVSAVEPYLTRYLPALVVAGVLPPLTVLTIGTQDLLSAAVVVCTLPLIPVFAILIGLATQEKSDRQWRTLSVLSGHFLDVVRGLPTLVAYRRAGSQSRRIREVTDAYRRTTLETLKVAFISSAALELIATISVALVAVTVGLRLAHGNIDFTTALIVLLLAPEAYWPLRRVGAEFHAAAEGTSTFEQIHELLSTDEPAPAGMPSSAHAPLVGTDLTLGYADLTVVSGLSFAIPPTGLTAIVGPSGCGKSTLLAALLGELTPQAGSVTLGKHPIGGDEWQRRVAHVGQRPWLLTGSIADNVRVGRPSASDAEIRSALTRVRLELPLDTPVGEDGRLLSAGQRARLALARVVIAQRPWVILDEPTAHLDSVTEEALLDTLRDLARDHAVIVVAHRDAIADAADHVLTLPARSVPTVAPAPVVPARAQRLGVPSSAEGATPPPTRARRRPLLGGFLATMASSFGVALTATAGWLIARAAEQPPILYLMVAIVSVRMFGLGRPAWRYAERLVTHDDALRLLAERRAQVYDVLVPLVPGRLGRRRGDLLTSIVDDVDALVDEKLRVRLPRSAWVGTSLLATAVAAVVLPVTALVIAAVCVVGGAAAWLLARGAAASTEPAAIAARAEQSAIVVETLTHARSLVLWQADRAALDALDEAGDDGARAANGSALGLVLGRGAATVAGALGVVGIALLAADPLAVGAVSGPMVALLLMLPIALVDVLSPMADAGALSVRTAAAQRRVEELAEIEPALVDPPVSVPVGEHPQVSLREASVGWTDEPVLRDLSLELKPGSHLGVIGPSGCGKSTLAALLMKFLAPHSGQQLLDETDVLQVSGDEVRARVGLVDDDPHVFASNVAENIRLARPDASDEQVEAALVAAHLGPWLAELPAGLGTRIGEGAIQVSGGERARIGLARAVLADLPVLVLDEPTAHLDSDTARAVTDDLLRASRDRSLVWITHTTVGLDQMDDVLEMGVRPR